MDRVVIANILCKFNIDMFKKKPLSSHLNNNNKSIPTEEKTIYPKS